MNFFSKSFIVLVIIVLLISVISVLGLVFPICKLTGNPIYDLGNHVFLRMKYIQAGTFLMGSPQDESGRSPDEIQHQVTITRSFYMGVYEITQKQYKQIIGNNPAILQDPE
ncbi:MAG: SUMF1/EgtB/PvdO family nonheme iron enzyme, partial [Candidatus Ozemobacteraceae bacterium]